MTIAAIPALEGVALNIAITKVVPLFAGYVSGKELEDESVIRDYIRTLNSNARNSLSTLRTGLHQADRLDDWNTLEGALLKIDEFWSLSVNHTRRSIELQKSSIFNKKTWNFHNFKISLKTQGHFSKMLCFSGLKVATPHGS